MRGDGRGSVVSLDGLAQHADDLFRGVALAAHSILLLKVQNAPNSLKSPGPLLGFQVNNGGSLTTALSVKPDLFLGDSFSLLLTQCRHSRNVN